MHMEYRNAEGNLVTNPIEIVQLEVELLCYSYIEKNKGERPPKELIDQWLTTLLDAALADDCDD